MRVVALAALVMAASLIACGSDDSGTAETTSCSLSRSELGPFSDDTPLGQSMTDDQARARMANDGIREWLAVKAEGPWQDVWDVATAQLGSDIHTDLAWLDLNGEIHGLYEDGDRFGFTDLRVSRSFQGKIEHDRTPLFVGVDPERDANFDASCSVTAVDLGDEANENISNVLDLVRIEP